MFKVAQYKFLNGKMGLSQEKIIAHKMFLNDS